MGRILGIDYGRKRTGLAVSDPLRIIAGPLCTCRTHDLLSFLKEYYQTEGFEEIALGFPTKLNQEDTDITADVEIFEKILKKNFPEVPVFRIDERYSSKLALDAMLAGGMKKKDRRDKARVDQISAVLILQSHMERNI